MSQTNKTPIGNTMVNTVVNTKLNIKYNTRWYNWDNSSDYIIEVVKQLHIYGMGMKLGMPEQEHFERVVAEIQGHSALVVFSGDTPVGGISLIPFVFQNSHYPGNCKATGFMVVEPGHTQAVSVLIRELRRQLKSEGLDWLVFSRAVSDKDYLQRGIRLRKQED